MHIVASGTRIPSERNLIYFYGSGQRSQAVCGCDARGIQISSIDRLRLNGTIIPAPRSSVCRSIGLHYRSCTISAIRQRAEMAAIRPVFCVTSFANRACTGIHFAACGFQL